MKTKLLLLSFFLLSYSTIKAQFIPCDANFTYTVNPSGLVNFTGTVSTSTAQYFWTFGNGTSGTGISTSCLYNTMGSYSVCLVVTDSNLLGPCVDSNCITINIGTLPSCMSSFYAALDTSAGAAPNTYNFINTSIGTGLSYTWIWGDGTPNTNSMNPSHTYPGAGPFMTCLAVDNGGGCIDTSCQSIWNVPPAGTCNASFYIYQDTSFGATPHTYLGVNNSSGPVSSFTYNWIWGDGTPNSTVPYPTHTYAAGGFYNICLVVTGMGCVDSFCLINQLILKTASDPYTVTFLAPTGLNQIEKDQTQIYPNPADDKIFIEGDKLKTYQIEIYTISGTKILSTSTKGNQAIDISALPVNLYLLKVTDDNGKTAFAKLIKQ